MGDYVVHHIIALLAKTFLRRFRPDQCWSLTYAIHCSKPRVGEFGGGAIFVTADKINHLNAYDWIAQQQAAFQKKRRKSKPAKKRP